MNTSPYILWFTECDRSKQNSVGGKCANLGEMLQANVRVPPGFAVTTHAYRQFLNGRGIGDEITRMLDALDVDDIECAEETSRDIRQLMSATPIPPAIEDAICYAYEELCAECHVDDLPVAVRSSATAEDLPGASFAGQQETTLWVRSAPHVLIRTAICWSSLFTARAIAYRKEMGFPHDKVHMSVGVQKMANSRAAGVMFTLNPINGDRSKIAIDSSWGLGESVVSGVVTPDNYLVDKVTEGILQRTLSPKLIEYIPNHAEGKVEIADVPQERQTSSSLNDDEIINLTILAKCIEGYYHVPMDIEWGIDRDLEFPENVMLLQCRPETVWSSKPPTRVIQQSGTALDFVIANMLKGVRVK